MGPRAPGPKWAALALALLLPTAVLAAHAASYLPFLSDDTLISLRYAQRLLDGHGLTWTEGPRVEGYSNLLWTLGVAGIGALGIDLIHATRLLAALCGGAMVAVVVLPTRPRSGGPLPGLAGGLALALSGSAAVWMVGGLEQPLSAAALGLALVLLRPLVNRDHGRITTALLAGLPLAMACLNRPDGPLFTAVAAGVLLWVHRFRPHGWRLAVAVAALPGLATLIQLAVRRQYYGDWVPNTAHIKAAPSPERALEGLTWLSTGALGLLPLVLLALWCGRQLWQQKAQRGLVGLVAAWAGTWCLYIVSVGGDIFPGWRHLLIVVVLLCQLVAIGLAAQARSGRTWGWVGAALMALALFQQVDPENQRARSERWEWEAQSIGLLLGQAFETQQPLLAVTAAGSLPYFSGLPSLDMLGLNDRHIALQPPAPGQLGHDHGDGDYVLDAQPDLVAFHRQGLGVPIFKGGEEMAADPRFDRDYVLRRFEALWPQPAAAMLWVRTEGRVGLARTEQQWTHPGWLLEGSTSAWAPTGRMLSRLPAATPATTVPMALPEGVWTITIEPPSPWIQIGARVIGGEAWQTGPDQLHSSGRGEVQLALRASIDTLVHRLVLTRALAGPSLGPPLPADRIHPLGPAGPQPGDARPLASSPLVPAPGQVLEFDLGASLSGLTLSADGRPWLAWSAADGDRTVRLDLSAVAGTPLQPSVFVPGAPRAALPLDALRIRTPRTPDRNVDSPPQPTGAHE